MRNGISRRQFIGAGSAAAALAPVMMRGAAAAETDKKAPLVCVFSKHLQFLDYEELADTCKKLALDGVDLTVRHKGHVEPETVAEDLPRAVEAIRKRGLDVPMITTNLRSGDAPEAEAILKAASGLGIRYFRVGGHRYDPHGNPWERLDRFADELKSLAALAEGCDMIAGYHNHSGEGNVAGPLWDLRELLARVGSEHLGSNFDLGHAKVEGAYGAWQVNTRLMAPYIKMMAIKDFVWVRDKPKWVPLGDGIVPAEEMLRLVRQEAGFSGPISMHFEYRPASDMEMVMEIRKTTLVLRELLRRAGYR